MEYIIVILLIAICYYLVKIHDKLNNLDYEIAVTVKKELINFKDREKIKNTKN